MMNSEKENSKESINERMLFLLQKKEGKKVVCRNLKNDFLTYMNCKLAEHQVLQNV